MAIDIPSWDGPIALLGYAKPKPGKEQALLDTLRSFVGPTRLEEGSIAYHLHRVPGQDGLLAFYEQWADTQSLRRHLQLPRMQAFLQERMDLLEHDLEITFVDPIEPA